MANFAEIDENYIVKRVVVVNNSEIVDEFGQEQEMLGRQFLSKLFGGSWVQTSYNAKIRKNFAGPGFTFDPVRNAFIPPKPYNSWLLDESTCNWVSPVPYPSDGENYVWDDITESWVKVTE